MDPATLAFASVSTLVLVSLWAGTAVAWTVSN